MAFSSAFSAPWFCCCSAQESSSAPYRPRCRKKRRPPAGTLSLYLTALMLGLSNPLGILFFTAVFAGSGLANTNGSLPAAILLVAGVASGSLLWWVLLSTVVSLLGRKLSPRTLSWINRTSGLLIAIFGVLMLVR